MIDLVEKLQRIDELEYGKILHKQQSITRLFPPFYQRVKKVAGAGGVRLQSITPEIWKFKIKSASEAGLWYEAYVHWKGIEVTIRDKAMDKRLWTKDKSRVDFTKLAVEVLYGCDMELVCNCPADLYWGGHYIRTRSKSKYTEPELRSPDVRNPKQYGALCKHLNLLFDVLPFYASTMSKWLKTTYLKDVEKAEAESRKATGGVKQAADFLKKKEEEEKKAREEQAKKRTGKEEEVSKEEQEKKKKEEEQAKKKEKEEEQAKKKEKEEEQEGGEEETKESVRRLCQCLI